MAFWNNLIQRNKEKEQEENLSKQLSRNNNYEIFAQVNSDIERAVAARSIVSRDISEQNKYKNPLWQNVQMDGNSIATPLSTNKVSRIQQYRLISRYPECQWALEQICDDFVHENVDKQFITLKLPNDDARFNQTRLDILQNEFKKFIDLFNFKDNGFNLVKRFLIEGELCWENIIKHDHPELGIIGVRFIEAQYYETLVDLKTRLPVGILIDTKKMGEDAYQVISNSCQSNTQIFNNVIPTTGGSFNFNVNTCIPLLWSQLTYINSGDYSFDDSTVYPVLERARQAYQQLALLQDAAVILRVTRAPERLLFNVSTGKMNNNYADAFVRDFAQSLKAKKVATPNGKDVASVYNPVSMLESYVFGKSDANDGTTVETVGSSADYDQLGDIEYFMRRFLKQLTIPWSRYKTPENTLEKNDAINYEEYAFSRMIIRYQRRFASGFKKSFITHLKLRDIWDKYEMKKSDLDIEFVKPILYDLYQTGKEMEQRMGIYKLAVEDEIMSKSEAMKKYLGWTDEEILQNFRSKIKETELSKLAEYFADKLAGEGPTKDSEFYKSPIPIKGIDDIEPASEGNGNEENNSGNDEGGGVDEPPPEEPPPEKPPEPEFGLDQ